jgi:hypothetical protein
MRETGDEIECFQTGASLACDLNSRVRGEQTAQLLTGHAFIVDDQRFHLVAGIDTVAVTRPSPLAAS